MNYPQLIVVLLTTLASCSPVANWADVKWDIIVVGSGPAGVIAASRSAATGLRTLLLETGGLSYAWTGESPEDIRKRSPSWLWPTNLTRVDVPGLYSSIFSNQGNLTCGPLVNAFSGCTLGGNSAINAGLFFEPPASDYDRYFPMGWKAKDMVNATKRVYSMQPSTNITSLDGKRYFQSGYDAVRKWIVGGVGFKEVDLNGNANEKTRVFGHPIYAVANGQRGGPVVSYLKGVLKKTNFHVQVHTRVLHVERQGNKVTGVTILLPSGQSTTVVIRSDGRGRVILSGGALFSPSLLMHSGIGPEAEINRLLSAGRLSPNITSKDLIINPSVGSGLFDNPNTFIELSSPAIQSFNYLYEVPPANAAPYINNRTGPYTFGGQTAVFFDTVKRSDNSTVGFQGTVGTAGYGDFTNSSTITLNIYGTSGLNSTGKVGLNSNFIPTPSSSTLYSNPLDAQAIASWIYKLFQSLPSSNSGLIPLNLAQNSTVQQIEKYITSYTKYTRGFVNHWSSSCRIGKCVDSKLQVIGTKGLYVIDASVVEPLSVNPMFGIMAVAEKGIEGVLKGLGKKIV